MHRLRRDGSVARAWLRFASWRCVTLLLAETAWLALWVPAGLRFMGAGLG